MSKIYVYFKRLGLALIGKPHDLPVRNAQSAEIIDLIPMIPDIIFLATDKTRSDNLRWMMNRCLSEKDTFPVDKTGRWIGFVQGVLAVTKFLEVDAVRDRSRARFHQAYRETGQSIPETKTLKG